MLVYDITDEGSFQKIGQMINGIKEVSVSYSMILDAVCVGLPVTILPL